MLYHTYWRCCGHSAAGLVIGVALVAAGVVGIARVAIVLPNSDDDAGTTIESFSAIPSQLLIKCSTQQKGED